MRRSESNFEKDTDAEKNPMKGNSEDSLYAIYVLRILKKYSSPDVPLTCQDVMDYMMEDHSIGKVSKEDAEKYRNQKKKFSRLLDTLHESFGEGCIGKIEGKNNRESHKWFYDAAKDKLAFEENGRESLSEVELDFLIDIISSSKIINSDTTLGMIDKLLKKTKLSAAEQKKRKESIRRENWTKTINDELVARKKKLEELIEYGYNISFDYASEKSVVATPYGLVFQEGRYVLKAKVGDEYSAFSLEKMQNIKKLDFADEWDDEYFDEIMDIDFDETDQSINTSLESLFLNIPVIKSAIKEKRGIVFKYLSYTVDNQRLVLVGKDKRVLPHSLVFNDGKYYLIGIDETDENIGFFRVDLMSSVEYATEKIRLSAWNEMVFERIERARAVDNHPLMMAGQEIPVTFLVWESALDRVIDSFGTKVRFQSVKEERTVPALSADQKWNENHSLAELRREKLVKVWVRTTREEAFRWALSNADVVELIGPQDIRDKLRRIADPVHKTYAKTLADKAQKNVDRIMAGGIFEISYRCGEDVAVESYRMLSHKGASDVVFTIEILGVDADDKKYLAYFKDAKWIRIEHSESVNPKWISELIHLKRIQIADTLIEDMSWLDNLEDLEYLRVINSPINDLSVLAKREKITYLEISNTNISNIDFIVGFEKLKVLDICGCPIKDYSPLLKIPPLETLVVDEKAAQAIGMEKLKEHHPSANILVKQKVINRPNKHTVYKH